MLEPQVLQTANINDWSDFVAETDVFNGLIMYLPSKWNGAWLKVVCARCHTHISLRVNKTQRRCIFSAVITCFGEYSVHLGVCSWWRWGVEIRYMLLRANIYFSTSWGLRDFSVSDWHSVTLFVIMWGRYKCYIWDKHVLLGVRTYCLGSGYICLKWGNIVRCDDSLFRMVTLYCLGRRYCWLGRGYACVEGIHRWRICLRRGHC